MAAIRVCCTNKLRTSPIFLKKKRISVFKNIQIQVERTWDNWLKTFVLVIVHLTQSLVFVLVSFRYKLHNVYKNRCHYFCCEFRYPCRRRVRHKAQAGDTISWTNFEVLRRWEKRKYGSPPIGWWNHKNGLPGYEGRYSGYQPFTLGPKPLFQSEALCQTIDLKMIFHSHSNKTHFQKKSFALSLLALKSATDHKNRHNHSFQNMNYLT